MAVATVSAAVIGGAAPGKDAARAAVPVKVGAGGEAAQERVGGRKVVERGGAPGEAVSERAEVPGGVPVRGAVLGAAVAERKVAPANGAVLGEVVSSAEMIAVRGDEGAREEAAAAGIRSTPASGSSRSCFASSPDLPRGLDTASN